jgi:antirestriction protein ArdC
MRAQGREGITGRLCLSSITRTETDRDSGEESERDIYYLKGYTVFNVEQIDRLPAQYHATEAPQIDPMQRIAEADAFFAATGAAIGHGGNRAFYSPAYDRIQMPPFEAFRDAESYYATLAHETTHNAVTRIMPNA